MLQLLSAMPKATTRHLHKVLRRYHMYIDWCNLVVGDKSNVEIEETTFKTNTHDGIKNGKRHCKSRFVTNLPLA